MFSMRKQGVKFKSIAVASAAKGAQLAAFAADSCSAGSSRHQWRPTALLRLLPLVRSG